MSKRLLLLCILVSALASCKQKSSSGSQVPKEAQRFSSVNSLNEFREAYVMGIVRDLHENGKSSIYMPREGGRIDFEHKNIFIINDGGVVSIGYVRDPLGPSKVYSLASGKWRYEE